MNKIILFVLLFLAVSLYSQKKDTIITINPFGLNTYPQKKYRYGNTVKFKITNVNVFKLNGSIEGKGETPVFEIPQIFKDVEGGGATGGEGDIQPERESDQPIESKDLTSLKKSLLENKQKFIANLYKINNYLSFKDRLNIELKDSIFIRDLKVLKANVASYYAGTFDTNITEDLEEIDNTIGELLESYSAIKLDYDSINKTLKAENFQLSGELKAGDKKTVFKVEKASVSVERKKYFEKEMAYVNKLRDSLVKPETQKMIKEKVVEGLSLYRKIKEESFAVYTDSYQLLDDIVTLTPKLKDAKGKVVHSFESIQLKTRYKWKVNFSSGYLLSFIGDENFSYKTDMGKQGVQKAETSKVTHALGGMLHVYKSFSDGFQPALSTGLSMNSNGTLGFYGGLSFLFTEKNRMVFTLGYSLTNVKVLDRGNLDKNNLFVNTNDLEIRYNDVYKGAFFIGVTYNLSKPK
ncbi:MULTISPECIES: hypothetical protein [unclassified Tenacibaculum]|uniref:hypothetical protein n=1 Tax=unclassified Tenacibaculum TaxID=2635139 RepID=UPI001F2CE497|nr:MULTISPECIES: hypothetical protein [unclassified Tenacibaculum]MCF2875480.1 hypothetical protein [Tenacibaculum sp. Cn5-1]MCF2935556.1 hypothetical protein [Tenacibaculum sp. Cn5-34]MCG7512116.1 hypothetical protein [Tenacibaculum sp. Cn5-46]